MYGDVDTAPLWLRILGKYLIDKCNLKSSNSESCIFYKKYDKGKLELMISVHVDGVFMSRNKETLKNTK